MKKDSLLAYGNAICLAAVLFVNYLAATVGINGLKTGEISDGIKSLFTPAGYVFSIWGLIYVLLIIFAISQLFPKNRDSNLIEKIGPLFMLSCVFNIAWMFAWHYGQIFIALLIMICIFLSLMAIYTRIKRKEGDEPGKSCFLIRIPFTIYFGWISVALIANVAAWLVVVGWNGFGIAAPIWTVVILVIAAVIAVWAAIKGDFLYPLVYVWAFIGIGIVNAGTQMLFLTAYVLAGLIFVFSVYTLIKNMPKTS